MPTISKLSENELEGRDRAMGELKWTGSCAGPDLVVGSNSQVRTLAEACTQGDANSAFTQYFSATWIKVMELDCFDLN